MERIEEDYKPLSMRISEFKERPFEALAFALGAAFVMALFFLSTEKNKETGMKEFLVLLLGIATYGVSFGSLLSAFLFVMGHDERKPLKSFEMKELRVVLAGGLVSNLLFYPALCLIKALYKS